MAERRVLQFDHSNDETRFEIEIVKELNNLKEKNMQNESTLQRISEENISLRHELQNKEEEHKRQLDEKNIVDQQKDELIQDVNFDPPCHKTTNMTWIYVT